MRDNNEVFEQDLDGSQDSGSVFTMQLLMSEKCEMPDRETMTETLQRHIGGLENFAYGDGSAGFAVTEYAVENDGRMIPPMLMITDCIESKNENIDAFTRSQMWDCPEHEEILERCKYQVVATDMLGGMLEGKDRAAMLMDLLEALIELYPGCEAVYFQSSGKMFTADRIRSSTVPRESRFIYFAVNVRFFNIEGTQDMIVDTLGMSTLYLPDLQYHFHGADPNHVVNHAYSILTYIFDNDCPIENADTVDGFENGEMNMDIQWQCFYEDSLIQPQREVIDICMNEFASGNRE